MRRAMAVLVTATTIGAAGFGLSPAGAQVVDAMAATPSAAAVGDEVVLSGSISCPGQQPGSAVMVSFFDPDEGPQTRAGLGDAMRPSAPTATSPARSRCPPRCSSC